MLHQEREGQLGPSINDIRQKSCLAKCPYYSSNAALICFCTTAILGQEVLPKTAACPIMGGVVGQH